MHWPERRDNCRRQLSLFTVSVVGRWDRRVRFEDGVQLSLPVLRDRGHGLLNGVAAAVLARPRRRRDRRRQPVRHVDREQRDGRPWRGQRGQPGPWFRASGTAGGHRDHVDCGGGLRGTGGRLLLLPVSGSLLRWPAPVAAVVPSLRVGNSRVRRPRPPAVCWLSRFPGQRFFARAPSRGRRRHCGRDDAENA